MDITQLMEQALELARQGFPHPNPYVGCLIVKDGRIIGKGHHQKAGEPHAEINCLNACTESVEGATMIVNLEPCFHYGRTPPCVDRIIDSGIKKVIVATKDPNPKTNGKSLQKLRDAGIEVVCGIAEEQAKALNAPFFKWITTGLPYVSLKAAITLDGKIATVSHSSQWISSEQSRLWVHDFRNTIDGILVGASTVREDNPQLSARTEMVYYPTRIVLSHSGDIFPEARIFSQPGRTIIAVPEDLKKEKQELLTARAEVLLCKRSGTGIDITDLLEKLGQRNISHLFVEGGSKVFTSFIKGRPVDAFYFIVVPKLLGDGISVMGGRIPEISNAIGLEFQDVQRFGPDLLITARYRQDGK